VSLPTKEGILHNLRWSVLECDIFTGVASIHCSFYYELYDRTICKSDEELDCYELILICIDKDETEYQLVECEDDNYLLFLYFFGKCVVRYFSTDAKWKAIVTHFVTATSAYCNSIGIFDYSKEYFEEESGLALPSCRLKTLGMSVLR
jgi:hypothetical protein